MDAPEVLFREARFVAVAKPSGWRTHPGSGEGPDVAAWLARQPDLPDDLAPAHRLDRGTSGVLLCGVGGEARSEAAEAFAAGRIAKRYLALVHGRTRTKGIVRRALRVGGAEKVAVTRYRTLAHLPGCSLLVVRPETGRKHQIRRHLQGLGHAVVGDERHPPRRFRAVRAFPGRLWLHAWRLTWPEVLDLTAPLPPALAAHLRALGAADAVIGRLAGPQVAPGAHGGDDARR